MLPNGGGEVCCLMGGRYTPEGKFENLTCHCKFMKVLLAWVSLAQKYMDNSANTSHTFMRFVFHNCDSSLLSCTMKISKYLCQRDQLLWDFGPKLCSRSICCRNTCSRSMPPEHEQSGSSKFNLLHEHYLNVHCSRSIFRHAPGALCILNMLLEHTFKYAPGAYLT